MLLVALAIGGVVAAAATYLSGTNIPVLDPKGPVANSERQLIVLAAALSLFVVIPVFSLLILIAIRYREGNERAKYSPHLKNSPLIEAGWWAFPTLLIAILGVVSWNAAHTLDPYRSIQSSAKPVTVQVVALDWKWLFLYPQQHIACVNEMNIPTKQPIHLQLTSDAPMNSFWIPQLSGQNRRDARDADTAQLGGHVTGGISRGFGKYQRRWLFRYDVHDECGRQPHLSGLGSQS